MPDLAEKLPPQNLDAERSVIGCMLLANEVIDLSGEQRVILFRRAARGFWWQSINCALEYPRPRL